MIVFITQGMQGSGKSTWAKKKAQEVDFKRVNRDELRLMMDNEQFNPKNEKFVSLVEDVIIYTALEDGFNLIIDSMNLNEKTLNYKINDILIHFPNAEIKLKKFFDISLDECIKRDQRRDISVGEEVLRSTYRKYKSIIEGDNK